MTIRYRCRDCSAPIVSNSPGKKGQPSTGHCDCPDAAWLLPWKMDPIKVVARGGLVDVYEEREREPVADAFVLGGERVELTPRDARLHVLRPLDTLGDATGGQRR